MDNPFSILEQRLNSIEKLLTEIASKPAPEVVGASVTSDDDTLSLKELAIYLKKDKTTIQRYKQNGLFPFYQAGRTVYVKKHEVDAALSSQQGKKKGGAK